MRLGDLWRFSELKASRTNAMMETQRGAGNTFSQLANSVPAARHPRRPAQPAPLHQPHSGNRCLPLPLRHLCWACSISEIETCLKALLKWGYLCGNHSLIFPLLETKWFLLPPEEEFTRRGWRDRNTAATQESFYPPMQSRRHM